jgi:hypothetical protein
MSARCPAARAHRGSWRPGTRACQGLQFPFPWRGSHESDADTATKETKRTMPLPPILGGAALIGGILLLAVGAGRESR